MRFRHTYALGLLAVLSGFPAFAQQLLTEAHLTGGLSSALVTNSLSLSVGISPDDSTYTVLFQDLFVQTGAVGHAYTLGPDDDAGFAAFSGYLTDGSASFLGYFVNVGGGGTGHSGLPESTFFTGLPPNCNGIDLGGFELNYVTLRFDALAFASPGTDPNGDGIWMDVSYAATFAVYGHPVPEPTSLALLAVGMVAFFAKAGWRTRQPTPGGQLGFSRQPQARRGCACRSALSAPLI